MCARLYAIAEKRANERDEPRLLRVKDQPVPTESLRQHVQHAPSVVLPGTDDDEIIGVPNKERYPAQPRLHLPLEPHIEAAERRS